MVSVAVKDFGPIVEGAVEIKPLTVFIGPNNSGKSHLATLLYALMQRGAPHTSLNLSRERTPRRLILEFYSIVMRQLREENSEPANEVNAWVEKCLDESFDFSNIPIFELPKKFIRTLETSSQEVLVKRFSHPLGVEMQRCFGSDVSALSRVDGSGSKMLSISLKHDKPQWSVNALPSGNDIDASASYPLFTEGTVNIGEDDVFLLQDAYEENYGHAGELFFEEQKESLVSEISMQIFNSMYRQFPANTYYLPAARSGILQSHKQLASAIVGMSPFAGIEPLEIDRLSGVVADFLSVLLTLEPETRGELFEVAEFLERRIARGRIYLESSGVPYPEIYYEARGHKFKMHRASSMVSELAPLILYLKHQLAPGDLLIFEEPESHLHPANQRILAHAIVKMVRKGVKVMITTHSDYFLPQLGNFVRLSALPAERARRGYDDEDYLNPDDVGCYLFAWDGEEGGSVVRELEVSTEEGIPEDEFADVGEGLYSEYADLYNAGVRSS